MEICLVLQELKILIQRLGIEPLSPTRTKPWGLHHPKRVPKMGRIITYLQRARTQPAKGLRANRALVIILSPRRRRKILLAPILKI